MDWVKILSEQVEKSGSIQAVADQLGYSRPAISLALKGTYPGGTARLSAKVVSTFCDRIICPHSGSDISQSDCTSQRTRPQPQSDATELRHWLACQTCYLNLEMVRKRSIFHA
jgi:hypothetical protein